MINIPFFLMTIFLIQGNKDIKFINERRYYLERFLRKLSKLDFLINSEEFLLFSRPNGDIEKMLQRVTKMSTFSTIERLRKTLDINESRYDLVDKERFHNNLLEYQVFAKKVLTQMKQLKKNIETFKLVKYQSITHNKVFFHLVDKYEELNMTQYLDGNLDKVVFLDPKNKELKD